MRSTNSNTIRPTPAFGSSGSMNEPKLENDVSRNKSMLGGLAVTGVVLG
jgi:hypothetical protein